MGWDPPLDLWDGIPPGISSRRVTAALGRPKKFPRKVPPGRSHESADDPGLSRWPSGGDNKNFNNVVLAHY